MESGSNNFELNGIVEWFIAVSFFEIGFVTVLASCSNEVL